MAAAVKFLQPPELREDDGDGPPIPPEVKQKLAEAGQMIQGLQGELQKMQQAIQTDAIKEQSKTEREMLLADLDAKFKAFLQELKGEQALELARLKASAELRLQDDAQRHDFAKGAVSADETRIRGGDANGSAGSPTGRTV